MAGSQTVFCRSATDPYQLQLTMIGPQNSSDWLQLLIGPVQTTSAVTA
jgi:hypothetical protein